MNDQMDGWMDRQVDEWKKKQSIWKEPWINRCMDGWMDGSKEGEMEDWRNGTCKWMEEWIGG